MIERVYKILHSSNDLYKEIFEEQQKQTELLRQLVNLTKKGLFTEDKSDKTSFEKGDLVIVKDSKNDNVLGIFIKNSYIKECIFNKVLIGNTIHMCNNDIVIPYKGNEHLIILPD